MVKVYDPSALGLHVVSVIGMQAKCLCPFHDDHRPSASFHLKKGLFYCFGCGVKGNVNQISRLTAGDIVMVDSAKIVEARVTRDEREWQAMMYHKLAFGNEYLASRGVADSLVEKFDIREYSEGVVFIIRDVHGRATGVQVRHYEGEPRYDFIGTRQPVWPIEAIKTLGRDEPVYVTEGVFGVLRASSAGLKSVAVMGAASIAPAARILNGRNAIAVFDNDFAGYLGAAKLVKLGFRAALPPFEADEATIEEWEEFHELPMITDNVLDLIDASPSPQYAAKLLSKFKM